MFLHFSVCTDYEIKRVNQWYRGSARLTVSSCFQTLCKTKLTSCWLLLHIYRTDMTVVSIFLSNSAGKQISDFPKYQCITLNGTGVHAFAFASRLHALECICTPAQNTGANAVSHCASPAIHSSMFVGPPHMRDLYTQSLRPWKHG